MDVKIVRVRTRLKNTQKMRIGLNKKNVGRNSRFFRQ